VSFVIDFAAQQYSMLATPNMKDIHDANLSFFSPQPLFIAAFFFPQQLFQLGWLYRLYKLDPTKSNAERQELDQQVDFVPYYSVGNICIAGRQPSLVSGACGRVPDSSVAWMVAWNSSNLKLAHVFVTVNTLI
jgi:hypothetical protein